ncbi:MAG: hypothetical protein GC187_10685 [Alphaproteobacteria bacterium]|nr:hypothetical protein [Alphaproteobacteria bacterium]
MIVRTLAVSLIAAGAMSGCMRLDMPEPASESWTLAQASDMNAGAAPVFVPERIMDPETLASMTAAERALLARGAQVRDEAASVADPEESAEDYAVRQRARANPPE